MFAVKYRKALLDDEVTATIQKTATEIAKRFPIEMAVIGWTRIIFIRCAVPIRRWRRARLCSSAVTKVMVEPSGWVYRVVVLDWYSMKIGGHYVDLRAKTALRFVALDHAMQGQSSHGS